MSGSKFVVAFFVIAAMGVAPIVAAGDTRLVIRDVDVVDVRVGKILPGRTVVVDDGRITHVAKAGVVEPGDDDVVVDAVGKFLIPGLWNMHVHLEEPGAAALGVMVANGVTSVRDMGTPFDVIVGYREAIAGGAVGPRIKAPGMMVTNPMVWGMLKEAIPEEMWEAETRRRLNVGTPEEARAAVQRAKNDGADFVKLHWNATPETYAALADECRRTGLTFAGHDPLGGLTLETIAEAGQRSIEHIDGSFSSVLGTADEAERARLYGVLKEHDTHFVPTVVTFLALSRFEGVTDLEDRMAIGLSGEGGRYVTPAMETFWRMFLGMYQRLPPASMFEPAYFHLRAMHVAGIPLMPGTDLGAPLMYPGSSLHDELAEFVDRLGMTPAEALRSATIVPAEFFEMGEDLGTVEEGMLADLVLLTSNPLENITNTRTIHSVVSNGRYIDPDERKRLLEVAVVRRD
jgi:hypothetical protein